MLSSTILLCWKFDGNDLKGHPCHSSNRNSLERYSRLLGSCTLRIRCILRLVIIKIVLELVLKWTSASSRKLSSFITSTILVPWKLKVKNKWQKGMWRVWNFKTLCFWLSCLPCFLSLCDVYLLPSIIYHISQDLQGIVF